MPAWIGPPRYNPARPDSVARDCLIVPVGSQASAEAPATATKMLTVSARAECESKEPRTGCITFIELAGTGVTPSASPSRDGATEPRRAEHLEPVSGADAAAHGGLNALKQVCFALAARPFPSCPAK